MREELHTALLALIPQDLQTRANLMQLRVKQVEESSETTNKNKEYITTNRKKLAEKEVLSAKKLNLRFHGLLCELENELDYNVSDQKVVQNAVQMAINNIDHKELHDNSSYGSLKKGFHTILRTLQPEVIRCFLKRCLFSYEYILHSSDVEYWKNQRQVTGEEFFVLTQVNSPLTMAAFIVMSCYLYEYNKIFFDVPEYYKTPIEGNVKLANLETLKSQGLMKAKLDKPSPQVQPEGKCGACVLM